MNLLWSSATNAETLPCLNSSPQCIEQLASKAIADSPQVDALSEQIALTNQRLQILSDRIDDISDKRWTNYITLDPLELVQNLAGGGGVRTDKVGIARLEIEKTNLKARRANLKKRKAEVKTGIRERILATVLQAEAAVKQSSIIWHQLENLRIQQQIAEINYRMGAGSPEQLFALKQQRQSLEHQLVQTQFAQEQAKQEVLSLTGGFEASTLETGVSEDESEGTEDRR